MIAAHNSNAPATLKEIETLLGSIGEKALMEIRRIGPTLSEVKEALTFIDSEDYMGAVLEKSLNPRPRRVYAILKQNRCVTKSCCCS